MTDRVHRVGAEPGPGRSGSRSESLAALADEYRTAVRRLTAEQAVVSSLGGASRTIEEGATRALDALCAELGWDLACLWLGQSGGELRLAARSHAADATLDGLVDTRGGAAGLAGVSLPTQALAAGGAIVSTDVLCELPTGDTATGASSPVRACAFPVRTSTGLAGAVELVGREGRVDPGDIVELSDAIGRELGRLIERVPAEAALRTSDEQFRSLVSNIPGAVYRCAADSDWTMEYISDDIESITGYRASDFLGSCIRSFASVIHVDDRERVANAVLEGVEQDAPFIIEYRVVHADGRVRWVYEKGQPVLDADGTARWCDGVILDVTDRKLAEAERERSLVAERNAHAEAEAARAQLAEQNEQLRQLDRLKDEFVALVSHELRTPLTSILGYVDLMLEEDHGGLMPDHRGFLDIVRRNSQRLLDLVGDLLFVAQVDAGKLTLETTRIDLVGLASECVETMRPRALDRQIDMRLESSGPIGIDGDPLRLGQLLDNLVSNAIKFTPERGHVVVRVMREEAGVVLAVADTGIGISKDEQAKLFERFFRTEGATRLAIQGTGLGLTIAKAIAEAHGGAISVESTPGIGTEFRVDFPPPAELAGELAA